MIDFPDPHRAVAIVACAGCCLVPVACCLSQPAPLLPAISDHRLGASVRSVWSCTRPAQRHHAPPEHRHPIRRGQEHFAELVGDQRHRSRPPAANSRTSAEQLFDFGWGQHRGRLVQQENPGAGGERLDDLQPLPLRHARVSPPVRPGRSLHQPVRQSRPPADPARPRPPVPPPARCFPPTVSAAIEVKCWCTMPMPSARASRGERIRTSRPVPRMVPASGAHHAVGDVHQGRLARPVLAQQRVHFARRQCEIGPAHRVHGAEGPLDIATQSGDGSWATGSPLTAHRSPSHRFTVPSDDRGTPRGSRIAPRVLRQRLDPHGLGGVVAGIDRVDARAPSHRSRCGAVPRR